MQFHLGAKVFTADGKEVGKVDRLVVDPRTDSANEFIVHRGVLLQHDVIIPISEVQEGAGGTNEHEVHLTLTADAVSRLPQFAESAYVAPPVGLYPGGFGGYGAGDVGASAGAGLFAGGGVLWPGPVYSAGTASGTASAASAGAGADATRYADGTIEDRLDRARPDDVMISHGTDVKRGDKKLGTVDELVIDPHHGKVTEVIIKRGLFGGKELRIPAQFIESVGDDAIYVTIDDARLEQFTVDAR